MPPSRVHRNASSVPAGGLADADDLTGLADADGRTARAAQRAEILHPARGGPEEGVVIPVRDLAEAHHLGGVVDAEGAALGAAERAETPHATARTPQEALGSRPLRLVSLEPTTSPRLLMALPALCRLPASRGCACLRPWSRGTRGSRRSQGRISLKPDDLAPVVDAASPAVRSAQRAQAPHALSCAPQKGSLLP